MGARSRLRFPAPSFSFPFTLPPLPLTDYYHRYVRFLSCCSRAFSVRCQHTGSFPTLGAKIDPSPPPPPRCEPNSVPHASLSFVILDAPSYLFLSPMSGILSARTKNNNEKRRKTKRSPRKEGDRQSNQGMKTVVLVTDVACARDCEEALCSPDLCHVRFSPAASLRRGQRRSWLGVECVTNLDNDAFRGKTAPRRWYFDSNV